jgi:hypothetical protein
MNHLNCVSLMTTAMEGSARVNSHMPFLQYLAKAAPRQLESLLANASDSEIETICEVALNYTEGNLKSIDSLSCRKNFIKTLASRVVSLDRKRNILNSSKIYRSVLQNLIYSLIK